MVIIILKKFENYFFRKSRYFWKKEKFFGFSIMRMRVVVRGIMILVMS